MKNLKPMKTQKNVHMGWSPQSISLKAVCTFLLLFVITFASAQSLSVKGEVRDSEGSGIPGVSVRVEGTTLGTMTNANGGYSLSVLSKKSTLIFSYIGMETQKIVVNNQQIINVTMNESSVALNEVVAIGYGTAKKSDVTGALASYNAKDIQKRPIQRVDQALVGQMAGVRVQQTTGVPGQAFSIKVRGTGSISAANEPLYVLDGFPLATSNTDKNGKFTSGNALDNIDPNDIESIQVLKDAAQAAIYGSRAANGVVLITTKRGQTGEPKISLNISAGFNEASKKLGVLNAEQFIDRATEMINSAWEASGTGRLASQTTAERSQILGLSSGLVNTNYELDDRWTEPGHPGLYYIDWQDEIFKKGLVQNYQVSASGATKNVNYYISGNYINQEGMVIGMDYTEYSARANVEVNVLKNLKVGLNLSPSYSITNDPGVEGKDNLLHWTISMSPVQDNAAENVNVGTYGSYPWTSSTTQFNSPVARLKNAIGRTAKMRTVASVYANYQIMPNLFFKTTVNFDNMDSNYKYYLNYNYTGTLSTRSISQPIGTTGTFSGYRRQTFVNENTLSYNKEINDVHNISLLAGASYNTDKLNTYTMSSTGGYSSSVITTLNAANDLTGSTTETKDVLLSYFGRAQYNYASKYLLAASIRRDGSSRFGADNKWGIFPSASAGWRISSEDFFRNNTVINNLMLRLSWGKAGNYNIGDYSSIPVLGTYNYSLNGALATGQAPAGVTNPALCWEKSETEDVGIDVAFFKNRITASLDYYTRLSADLLLNNPIPEVTGFSTVMTNIGKVRNNGLEFELTSHNLTGKFQWTTSLNLSHNTNEVVALGGDQTQILIPSSYDISHSILKVGEPMYSIYVVKRLGVLSQEDIDNGAARYGNEVAGDPKYFDANSDGSIDANDRRIQGHPMPDFTWGITNIFEYKGFDLQILLQGQSGGSIYSLWSRATNRTGMGYADNTLSINADRWRSAENPGNGIAPKAYSKFGRIVNTDWMYSSDYVRVRNITLGYDLARVVKSLSKQNPHIYVTAENFFGWDKYDGGYNPEASNTDLSGSTLFPESGDYGGLPLAKSIILGINITL